MVQANWDGAVNCPLKSRVLHSVIALLLHCPSYMAVALTPHTWLLHSTSYLVIALTPHAWLLHCSSYSDLVLLIQLISADADPAKHCITLIQFICTLYHH